MPFFDRIGVVALLPGRSGAGKKSAVSAVLPTSLDLSEASHAVETAPSNFAHNCSQIAQTESLLFPKQGIAVGCRTGRSRQADSHDQIAARIAVRPPEAHATTRPVQYCRARDFNLSRSGRSYGQKRPFCDCFLRPVRSFFGAFMTAIRPKVRSEKSS